jgi:RimJ/RimL family protein N-acetyltransferase
MEHELNLLKQPVGLPIPDWKPAAFPAHESMSGNFCRLEKLDPAIHAANLYQAYALDAEGGNWTYLPYGPFADEQNFTDWMIKFCCSRDPQFYAIIDIKSERAVGMASYLRIDPNNGSIEVGHLNFSPLLQHTPEATEAMYLLMARAFKLGYRRYEWKCNALNAPSRAAAQRLGFSFEGIFRNAAVIKGRNRDTAWYAMIDAEWPLLQAAFLQWLKPDNFDNNGRQRESLSVLTAPILKQRG